MMAKRRFQRQHDEEPLVAGRSGGIQDTVLPETVLPFARQSNMLRLQGQIGNAALQRMLTSPTIRQQAGADLIHRKGCSCAACAGQLKEEARASGQGYSVIQRFWDDDEESSDDGGSWLDSAVEAVSDTATSAWGSVTDTISDWMDGGESSPSESNEGGNHNAPTDENVPESAEGEDEPEVQDVHTNEGDWWDWMPDWWQDENEGNEDADLEEVETEVEAGSVSGVAACATGRGGGNKGNVSVAGLTTANFGGAQCPANFTPKSKKRMTGGNSNYWEVSGSMKIDYQLPSPTISYTVTPSRDQLTPCENEAVENYINETLSVHENEHVTAFNMFNGGETFNHTFNYLAGATDAELQASLSAAVDDLVAVKIQERQDKVQAMSDGLDPFNQPIPGLAMCEYYDENPQD